MSARMVEGRELSVGIVVDVDGMVFWTLRRDVLFIYRWGCIVPLRSGTARTWPLPSECAISADRVRQTPPGGGLETNDYIQVPSCALSAHAYDAPRG